ncbi:MAG: cytochrome c3 family protein [bacterium]
MAQLFDQTANTIARASVAGLLLLAAGAALGGYVFTRSSWATGVDLVPAQPVPFSHAHHVGGIGLDCRLCHTHAERGPVAGLPSVDVCMTCHREVWADADLLEPVRAAWRDGREVAWQRVHDLADYAYFHHGIHLAKGVGCEECHGRVDRMPLMQQGAPLTMEWCLDCHRDPAPRLRPPADVWQMGWTPPAGFDHAALAAELGVRSETDCTVCHR